MAKWLCLLFFPLHLLAQDTPAVKTYVKEECAVFDQPSLFTGKSVFTLQIMEPCLLLRRVSEPGSKDKYWWHIINHRGEGYIGYEYLQIDDRTLFRWERFVSDSNRIQVGKAYFTSHATEFGKEAMSIAKKRMDSLQKRMNSLQDSLSKFVVLFDSQTSQNAIDFSDYSFSVFNCNKTKRIKYVWVTVTAYNPVDDPVVTKTFEGIGPIEPFTSGSYEFSSGFRSSVVSYSKVQSVKIQYMDGSIIVIPRSKLHFDRIGSTQKT